MLQRKRIFIGGLRYTTTDDDLYEKLNSFNFGKITSCRVVYDMETGKSRGFAYVSFEEEASVDKAIERLHRTKDIDGRHVSVRRAISKN